MISLYQRRPTRGPHVALQALFCGPYSSSKNRPFKGKSTNSMKLSENLALNESIFKKCGPRPHLGWPTLVYMIFDQ
jgi:hypothetical protein